MANVVIVALSFYLISFYWIVVLCYMKHHNTYKVCAVDYVFGGFSDCLLHVYGCVSIYHIVVDLSQEALKDWADWSNSFTNTITLS